MDVANKPDDAHVSMLVKALHQDKQQEIATRAVVSIAQAVTKVLGRLLLVIFVLWWVLPHIDMWVRLIATGK